MYIEKLLRISGVFLVCVGILAGTFGWFTVDFKTYNEAKTVFEDLSDNPVAEASYSAAKTIFQSEISTVIASAIGGLIGGFVLIGLGKIIEGQAEIVGAIKIGNQLPIDEKTQNNTYGPRTTAPGQSTSIPIFEDNSINKKDTNQKQVPERILDEIERFYAKKGTVVQYTKTTSRDDVYQVRTINGDEFVELKAGYLPNILDNDKISGLE